MEIEKPQSQPAVSMLGALPIELLHRIARSLSTTELCALRLSCRAVEQLLFQSFSREFFTRKQFMMREFGLQALVDIAKHPNLSKVLEHVSLGLELLDQYSEHKDATFEQRRFYQSAVADQATLFSSGRAVSLLTEAFANLPNLETVSIRNFNSHTRFRDFDSGIKAWNSYGHPTFVRNTGRVLTDARDKDRSIFATSTFNAVTTALANADVGLQNLEVMLRKGRVGVLDAGFYTPRRIFSRGTFSEPSHMGHKYTLFLAGLRKLHIDVLLRDDEAYPRPIAPHEDGLKWGLACHAFIGHAHPSLEWLRINFQDSGSTHSIQWMLTNFQDGGGPVDNFLTYLCNPTPGVEADRLELRKLKQLDLGRAHLAPPTLHALFQHLPSIQILSLHRITLHARVGTAPYQVWYDLLKTLPVILPNLWQLEIVRAETTLGATTYPLVLDKPNGHIIRLTVEGHNRLEAFEELAEQLSAVPMGSDGITEDEDEDEDEYEDEDLDLDEDEY